MVKVLILGSTGMLGSAVGKWFLKQSDRYETSFTHRDYNIARKYYEDKSLIHFDCLEDDITNLNLCIIMLLIVSVRSSLSWHRTPWLQLELIQFSPGL